MWIGTQAIILPGIEIGNGAVIGARSVVTKDFRPYSIVSGNPARHIKWRFKEKSRKKLLRLRWCNWSKEKIKRNKNFSRRIYKKYNIKHS